MAKKEVLAQAKKALAKKKAGIKVNTVEPWPMVPVEELEKKTVLPNQTETFVIQLQGKINDINQRIDRQDMELEGIRNRIDRIVSAIDKCRRVKGL